MKFSLTMTRFVLSFRNIAGSWGFSSACSVWIRMPRKSTSLLDISGARPAGLLLRGARRKYIKDSGVPLRFDWSS